MKWSYLSKVLFAGILVFVMTLGSGIIQDRSGPPAAGTTFALEAPYFVKPVHAQTDSIPAAVATMLDQEAGISAYATSTIPINISGLKTPGSPFKTIETLPSVTDYIIGSVGIPGFKENFDVHVFVHKNGYFLAYYHRPDPVSKIFDIYSKSIGKNHLDTAIGIVAGVAGAPTDAVKYYDFRNPSATSLLVVGEDHDNGNSFTITLPAFTFFERSWQAADGGSNIRVDSTDNPNMMYDGYYYGPKYGSITQAQLSVGVPHTITANSSYAILVLEYMVP